MAIGNAPWPIGVTMVGIHARTGREKIFSQNIARILFLQKQYSNLEPKIMSLSYLKNFIAYLQLKVLISIWLN